MLKLLCPNAYVKSILELDLDFLKQKGILLLLFDLDNTLVEWDKDVLEPQIEKWFQIAKKKGFQLCILSNNNRERVETISTILDVPFIHKAIKPRKKAFLQAMKDFSSSCERTAVIGDQIFTDVLGGNRLGLYTILVTPLTKADFWGTKIINRNLEKIVLKKLNKNGLLKSSCL